MYVWACACALGAVLGWRRRLLECAAWPVAGCVFAKAAALAAGSTQAGLHSTSGQPPREGPKPCSPPSRRPPPSSPSGPAPRPPCPTLTQVLADRVGRQHRAGGDGVEVVVLWRVGVPLEHVQHALRDREPAPDVDRRREHGRAGQRLRGRARQQAAAGQHDATDRGQARDGVCDRHEGRVQGGRDAPHGLVAADGGQPELGHHRAAGGRGRERGGGGWGVRGAVGWAWWASGAGRCVRAGARGAWSRVREP